MRTLVFSTLRVVSIPIPTAAALLAAMTIPFPAAAACPTLFAISQTFVTGQAPRRPVIADFNRDGAPDFALAAFGADTIDVFINNGDGTFAALALPTGSFSLPLGPAVGDFNEDGKPDLAYVCVGFDQVLVRMGNGDGTFAAPTAYSVVQAPTCVAVGDFDRNGHRDLAISRSNGGSYYLDIRAGAGTGAFGNLTSTLTDNGSPELALVHEFMRDGIPCVAICRPTGIDIMVNDGTGAFSSSISVPGIGSNSDAALADFNRDSRIDLAVTHNAGGDVSILLGAPSVPVMFNAATHPNFGGTPSGVAVADFNRDAFDDLVVTNLDSDTVTFRLGDGTGGFAPASSAGAGDRPIFVASADFNRDGLPDLLVINDTPAGAATILLQVVGVPEVFAHPQSLAALTGDNTGFSVLATWPGTGPLAYQWRRNAVNLTDGPRIVGSTSSNLVILNAMLSDAAAYDCIITSLCGSTRTDPAALTLTWRCPADFNQSGAKSVQDLFDYLKAYFAPCP